MVWRWVNAQIGYGWAMFALDTRWFDVAVITSVFAVGSILFGRFEEHKPRGQRVLKLILVSAIFVGLAAYAGRAWAYGLIAVFGLLAAYVQIWWLPSKGINGWTGEPRDKYLALMARKKP